MKTVATLTSHVIRLNDPAPAPVTLDDWFCVRTHRTTFRACDGRWTVELHLPPAAKRFTVTPLDGGDPRHLDTLLEVAALLKPGTTTSPAAQPEEIYGTITNHPWRYVADDEVRCLCDLAFAGEVIDACGHQLPPDLTPLEARLCLLSDFSGYCLLGIAHMSAQRLQLNGADMGNLLARKGTTRAMTNMDVYVPRIDDPRPSLITLADWDHVRTRISMFMTTDRGWDVQKHPYGEPTYLVTNRASGSQVERPTLASVAQLLIDRLGMDGVDDRDPTHILGTISGHVWGYVATEAIVRLQEEARCGQLHDACPNGGHQLPADLTALEAQLALLSVFEGHCRLVYATMGPPHPLTRAEWDMHRRDDIVEIEPHQGGPASYHWHGSVRQRVERCEAFGAIPRDSYNG